MYGLRLLTYHRVGHPRGDYYEKLTVPPLRFEREMNLMRRLGFDFVDPGRLPALFSDNNHRWRWAAIPTFDDGYAEIYEHVLPVLKRYDLPAIVYVVTDRDRANWTDWGSYPAPDLLTWSQLEAMVQEGVTIGSHTATHADLTKCDASQLENEIAGSKKKIEDRLGVSVKHFCYPYGYYNREIQEAVRRAGYETGCTTDRGVVRPDTEMLEMSRLGVGKRMSTTHFCRRMISGG